MKQNSREWLKSSLGIGGLILAPSTFLNANEEKNFNQRKYNLPIKLSSNENPYGPSKRVLERVKKSFEYGCRYPYSYADDLSIILARKHSVDPESIIITGGSTEGLRITGVTFSRGGGEIIAAKPTFLALTDYAQKWGATVNWVPVTNDMGYDLDEIEKRISKKTKLVFLCNPNNPTGTLVPKEKLNDFCSIVSKDTVLFSDEAYYEFIEQQDYPSMINLVKQGLNVVVSKTFSKVYGMAGLRIGYLIAKPELAKKIRENIVAMSNVLAIEGAKEALVDKEFFNFSINKTNEAKESIYETLDHLGLRYVRSHTNFIFFKSGIDIRKLGPTMLEKGVRIGRPFPPFYDWCRISCGTSQEVNRFITSILEVYG